MARTLRPLSLGQLLDETFNLYRRNFLLFIGISALPNLALLVIGLALELSARSDRASVAILSALASLVSSLLILPIVTAATTFAVSDVYLENPTSIGACFARLRGKILRVVGVSFIVGLLVGLGAMLCIVPGIYLAGKYGLAIPAAVLDNTPGLRSLDRSAALTRDAIGRVILVYFLTAIFTVLMAMAFMGGVALLGASLFGQSGGILNDVVQEIISTVGAIVFGPLTAIGLTLVYYDQRVRKEAFDIERMMVLMGAQQNAAAAQSQG